VASVFGSRRALEALAALEQRETGLRLTELAESLAAPVSSTQVAVAALIHDGFAAKRPDRPVRFQLVAEGRQDASRILDVVSRRDGEGKLLAAALRASPAVEFAARDEAGLLLVIRWDAEPSDEVRLDRMLKRAGLEVTRFGHEEIRDHLRDDASVRDRARRGQIIVGSVDRSFPDPFRHGAADAERLGRLHPAIRQPSRSALVRLARRFGLSEIRVFGSAVHADFRPDSDVDVMVRRKHGVRRTLEDDLSLRRDLETLVGRDVDLSDASVLREPVRAKAESEGVVIYG
jgi:predicted nucleotidyltransferase